MGSFSIWHWLIVLVVVVLVFGTKKLRNLGTDLGSAVKGFRKAMSEADQDEPPKQINKQADADFTENRQNETAGKKSG